jgi:hypothetical protein
MTTNHSPTKLQIFFVLLLCLLSFYAGLLRSFGLKGGTATMDNPTAMDMPSQFKTQETMTQEGGCEGFKEMEREMQLLKQENQRMKMERENDDENKNRGGGEQGGGGGMTK